ncbi:hypothetical protein GCM10023319_74310 [Nocardia iowensis]
MLCGDLRLPYDTSHGASGHTKLVVKAPRIDHGGVRGETEEHIEYRQNDREVRQTIDSGSIRSAIVNRFGQPVQQ